MWFLTKKKKNCLIAEFLVRSTLQIFMKKDPPIREVSVTIETKIVAKELSSNHLLPWINANETSVSNCLYNWMFCHKPLIVFCTFIVLILYKSFNYVILRCFMGQIVQMLWLIWAGWFGSWLWTKSFRNYWIFRNVMEKSFFVT